MSYVIIEGTDKRIDLSSVKWIRSDKTEKCEHAGEAEGRACPLYESGACKSSLNFHCCKHVVKASDREKAAFCEAAGLKAVPDTVNRSIRDRYQTMAQQEVPNQGTPIVGLETINGAPYPKLFCVNSLNGVEMTDFILLPASKRNPTKIVSLYHNEYDFEGAWLLLCCYEKYIRKNSTINGATLASGITDVGLPYCPEYNYQFPISSSAFQQAGSFYSRKTENMSDGATVYYTVKKLCGKIGQLDAVASALASVDLTRLPPPADRLDSIEAYKLIKFQKVSVRRYVLLRYLQTICNINLDWKPGFGEDNEALAVLRYRLSDTLPKKKGAKKAAFWFLWLYIQMEREFLDTHYLGIGSENGLQRDELLRKFQAEQEALGLRSEIFASTAYALTASYAGYLMGLACLAGMSGETGQDAWSNLIKKEKGVAVSIIRTLKAADHEAIVQWRERHRQIFHLDEAESALSKALSNAL